MRFALALASGLALLAAGPALAQQPAPLTTAHLGELCEAGRGDNSVSSAAAGYCRGAIVMAGQYHAELVARGRPPVFCLPDPSPSQEAAQASFASWVRANPQYAGDKAVLGVMRWAALTYPCPTPPAAPAARRR